VGVPDDPGLAYWRPNAASAGSPIKPPFTLTLMPKRVYSALRTDPLRAMIQEQENRRLQDQLTNLFTRPPTPPDPRPEPEHVHGRGTRFPAGCEGCRAFNRAYYHAHKSGKHAATNGRRKGHPSTQTVESDC
jgi:hypothetical protein